MIPLICVMGCSTKKLLQLLPARSTRISVITTDQTNDSSAIAIDFVAIYNQPLATALTRLSAAEWFKGQIQFQKDYTPKKDYQLWHYEFPALPQKHNIQINPGRKMIAILIFADYLSPGKHRYRLTKIEEMNITLNKNDFEITPLREEK